jgi:hypothetical protein
VATYHSGCNSRGVLFQGSLAVINLSALIKNGIAVLAVLTGASFVFSIWTAATGGNFLQVVVATIFLSVVLSAWWQK